LQRLERLGARDVGRAREPPGPHEGEGCHRRHELRPVDECEPLLDREARGLEPRDGERLGPREEPAGDGRLALADERQREMRQRREITACPDRAAGRDVGKDSAVEAFEQQLDGPSARSGKALRQRVRAQEHRRAHDLGRIWLTHAAGVAS
jgi:hypothetical protein